MAFPYREYGKEGHPIVFLHAFPLSSAMWEPNAPFVAAEGFRVIAPDLPGFGENLDFNEVSGIDEMAAGVSQLLDALEIGNAVFVGLSMGGYVLFSIYRQFPEIVSALVFCDTVAGADTEEKRKARFDLTDRLEKEGAGVLAETMLPNLVSAGTAAGRPGLVGELSREFSLCDPAAAAAALRGMAARSDSKELLEKITVPTMFVFGKDDAVTGIDAAQEMHSLVRNSALEIIEGAGHYSSLENPSEFNGTLISFLNSL